LTLLVAAMSYLFVLAVLGGAIWYFLNPNERAGVKRTALDALQGVRAATVRERKKTEAFAAALRERTRFALVTPTLILLNLVVFCFMISAEGSFGSPESLVAVGASFGPRTTNGEWHRLVTSIWVHAGLIALLVNSLALFQVGVILERLVGHLAFATVYLVAGVLASIVSLFADPLAVTGGSSGAVFGIYGLMLAAMFWSLLQRSILTVPWAAIKPLGPVAALFILYHLAFGSTIGAAHAASFAVGIGCGLVLTREVRDHKPESRQLAVAMGATLFIVTLLAVPLAGIADVRPEIARILAAEERTAVGYEKQVKRFTIGSVGADVLASEIDRAIIPELDEASARLEKLGKVPPEHEPIVANAQKYLKLRTESWRLRSLALRLSSMPMFRKADRKEWEALEILKDLRI
jgi:rhomboid protease GluP